MNPGGQGSAVGTHGRRRRRSIALYTLACLIGGIAIAGRTPERHGDGFEYLVIIEAFHNHASPDLRPGDLASLRPLLAASGIPVHSALDADFYPARGGRRVSWHFWLYPLLATPIRAILEGVGADPLAALQVLNAGCLGLAIGVVLFVGHPPARERWIFLGLVAVGPVWWFVPWTHPEVMTWSAVVIAVWLVRTGHHAWAALAAAVGATQNLPVALLGLWIVGFAFAEGDRRRILLTALALLPAAAPILYSLWAFGTPSLIVSRGVAGWQFLSWQRVHSLLFDLNQGISTHMPWLVALWLVSAVAVAARRDLRGLFVLGALAPLLAVSATQGNWNGGTAGIMRYGLWMTPLMAWLVVDHLPRFRGRDLLLAAAILAELPLVVSRGSEEDYVEHGPVAAWVLEHAPALYSPLPEIFIERTLHLEANEEPLLRSHLPVVYARADGIVTKLVYAPPVRPASFAHLAVAPGYLEGLRQRSPRGDAIVYDEPPLGAVRKFELMDGDAIAELEHVSLRLLEPPHFVTSSRFAVPVQIDNRSARTFWHTASTTPTPLNVAYHVWRGEELVVFDGLRTSLPGPLRPETAMRIEARVELPEDAGLYRVELDLVLEQVKWLGAGRSFEVRVEHGRADAGRAAGLSRTRSGSTPGSDEQNRGDRGDLDEILRGLR